MLTDKSGRQPASGNQPGQPAPKCIITLPKNHPASRQAMLLQCGGDACFLFLVAVCAKVSNKTDIAVSTVNQILALLVSGMEEAEPHTVEIIGR
ncbi:hypothetical protein D3C80_1539630 [compost metagenome]